jgi:predicted metalloprotease with PDZ domain
MQHIYTAYYVEKERGFSEDEFKKELEKFVGENLDQFYADIINGTEIPDYAEIFDGLGVDITYNGSSKPNVGVSLSESGGKTTVGGIRRNSAAEDAGLSVNDEIIGVNGLRADKKSLEEFFQTVNVGDEMNLLIARDQELYSIVITVTAYERPSFKYEYTGDTKPNKLSDYWLRSDKK